MVRYFSVYTQMLLTSSLIRSIFDQSQKELIHEYNSFFRAYKLLTVTASVVSAARMAELLKPFKQRSPRRIPAFYDPTLHTIYINKSLLRTMRQSDVHTICRHELIHACSFHANERVGDIHQFRSGIKVESFYALGTYRCQNRMLNEGLVQYFTLQGLGTTEAEAYKHEVAIVGQLEHVIGQAVLGRALFSGELSQLQSAFDGVFGDGKFLKFSQAVDDKHFSLARAILMSPATLQPAVFLSLNQKTA